MSEGVLYTATGTKFIDEAKISAQSLKKNMSGVNIAMITDEEVNSPLFDKIISVDDLQSDFGASVLTPDMSPFDKTIFLDTDTYVCDDISELFNILDDFDLSVCLAPNRKPVPEVPLPWREYNTGVISYSDSELAMELLEKWYGIYQEWRQKKGIERNQQSFTKAVYDVQPDVYTLPSEYNTRVQYPGYLGRKTKIVHGRHPAGLENIEHLLNSRSDMRVFWPNSYGTSSDSFTIKHGRGLRYILERAVAEKGWRYAIKNSISVIIDKLNHRFNRTHSSDAVE